MVRPPFSCGQPPDLLHSRDITAATVLTARALDILIVAAFQAVGIHTCVTAVVFHVAGVRIFFAYDTAVFHASGPPKLCWCCHFSLSWPPELLYCRRWLRSWPPDLCDGLLCHQPPCRPPELCCWALVPSFFVFVVSGLIVLLFSVAPKQKKHKSLI